jgi:hypothetical protein
MSIKMNISLFAVLLVCVSAASAQTRTEGPNKAVFKRGGDIVTKNGRTDLGYVPIFNDGPNSNLFLYASFHNKVVFPDLPSLDIFFISVSRGPKYENAHDINIVADGERFSFTQQDIDFYSTRKGEYVVEGSGVSFTYENLARLVAARQVVVRVGATTFELAPEHLAALAQMARRMKN